MSDVLAMTPMLFGMSTIDVAEIDTLIAEIRRYLALVDLLRREGYEPRWQAERAALS